MLLLDLQNVVTWKDPFWPVDLLMNLVSYTTSDPLGLSAAATSEVAPDFTRARLAASLLMLVLYASGLPPQDFSVDVEV